MINLLEEAKELSLLTGRSVLIEKKYWSFIIRHGITKIQKEFYIYFSLSDEGYILIGPDKLKNFIKRKKILFRKFNVAMFKK